MAREDYALYVVNRPVDSVILEWCHVRMPNVFIVALSNATVFFGFFYKERRIFLMAGQKRCFM